MNSALTTVPTITATTTNSSVCIDEQQGQHHHCISCYSNRCTYYSGVVQQHTISSQPPDDNHDANRVHGESNKRVRKFPVTVPDSDDQALPSTIISGGSDSCPLVRCCICRSCITHYCKMAEHWLLCGDVQVECINKIYGCPARMRRRAIAAHLTTCPASVCICTVEWNRRPAYAAREPQGYNDDLPQKYPPNSVEQVPPAGFSHQLDVGLALRDQNLLDEAMLAPRSMRRRLMNHFTRHFPSMPLPKVRHGLPDYILYCHHDEEDEETNVERKADSAPKRDSSSLLLGADISDDDDGVGVRTPPTQHHTNNRDQTPSSSASHCSSISSCSSPHTPPRPPPPPPPPGLAASFLKIICNLPDNEIEPLVNNIATRRSSNESSALNNESLLSSSLAHLVHNVDSGDEGNSSSGRFTQNDDSGSPAPTFDKKLLHATCDNSGSGVPELHYLGLQLEQESLVHYQPKPKSLLTFTCHQLFRRDQFASHYYNAHASIQSVLPWIEQRCPLAYLGCTWSVRRCKAELDSCHENSSLTTNSRPSSSSAGDVVYSSLLQSYAVSSPVAVISDNGNGNFGLNDLPDEIVLDILRQVDNFSLCTLSMCNRRMRSLCATLLPMQGIVVQEWIIDHAASKNTSLSGTKSPKWKVGYQKWQFTTHFGDIKHWHLQPITPKINSHLHNDCLFYEPVDHTKVPFRLPDVPYRKFRHRKSSISASSSSPAAAAAALETEEWMRALGLRALGDYAV